MKEEQVSRRRFLKWVGSVSFMTAASSLLPFNPLLFTNNRKTKIKDGNGEEVEKVPVGRPAR